MEVFLRPFNGMMVHQACFAIKFVRQSLQVKEKFSKQKLGKKDDIDRKSPVRDK